MMNEQAQLILASSSIYRKELLSRLHLDFLAIAPAVDETTLDHETPAEVVERLSRLKARVIAKLHPHSWVIGSDQVADFRGLAISKPGTHEKALAQLQMMRGETVLFRTGVCLTHFASDRTIYACVNTSVSFHDVDDATLEHYLRIEKPYDCAGSAKAEGLGISLLSKIESDDPSALIGLPLITLTGFLRSVGFMIPPRHA